MELESATGKLNAYFDGRQPEIMGMIERLVNMDSFSEDGEDVNKVGETVSGWMREAGFHTEKIAKPAIDPDESWMEKLGNVFSARTHEREAGPGIVFLGHMDTVFPAGTAAARSTFPKVPLNLAIAELSELFIQLFKKPMTSLMILSLLKLTLIIVSANCGNFSDNSF